MIHGTKPFSFVWWCLTTVRSTAGRRSCLARENETMNTLRVLRPVRRSETALLHDENVGPSSALREVQSERVGQNRGEALLRTVARILERFARPMLGEMCFS